MKKIIIPLALCFAAIAQAASAACVGAAVVNTQASVGSGAAPAASVVITPTAPQSPVINAPATPPGNSGNQNLSESDRTVKNDIFKATNAARTAALGSGKQLKQNSDLDKVAAARVADMFKYQYFSHSSPSGATAASLTKQYGYRWTALGENIARGRYSSGSQIVAAWMNSPGHKANILSRNYTEIGVAAAYGKYNGRNQWIAVQVFGRPR